MSKQSPVLRRLITVSAVALGAGLALTACSTVKMGAAAVGGAGFQRITLATLDTEVSNLSQTAKQYPGILQLSQAQETQATLTWLVRFQINEQLARQAGITVSTGQAQKALAQFYSAAKSQAEAQGVRNVTRNLVLAAYGIPPNMSAELGRWQAIQNQFIQQANGGTVPTTTSAQAATTAKLQKAQCVAAKTLNIEINPQYGRLDYSNYLVVSAPGTVSRSAGPAPTASPSGLTPAC